jgi:hypothetical protein
MPTCPTCHVAAISAAQSASAVRDVGIVGALSIAAMPVLAIRRKHTVADVRVAGRRDAEPDARQKRHR